MKNKTIEYYNSNSAEYFSNTVNVNMEENYKYFISYLKPGSKVLDFGCGSGRDIKYFNNMGYETYGVDGSEKLCELAVGYTGSHNIRCADFLTYNEKNKYDGIWACASLLHLDNKELKTVIRRLIDACVHQGVIYASFKYGDYSGIRDNRYYTDMNEDKLNDLIDLYNEISIADIWKSKDQLGNRGDIVWLNVILRVEKQ